MSKLDLTVQEKTLVKVNDTPSDQENVNDFKKMDIDPQDWLEVFEEDQVKLEGCR